MKQSFIALLLFLWAIALNCQTLVNPGFEQPDADANSGQTGWNTNRRTGISSDGQEPHAGAGCMRLHNVPGSGFGSISQVVTLLPATAIRKFRVSGHIRRDSVEGYVGIWIKATDGGATSLFFDNMYDRQLAGSAPWARFSTDFVVDETAREVQIGGLLVGDGTAWFDDFDMEEIPMAIGAMPDSIRQFLNEAVDLVEKHALYRDSVNWPKVRSHVMAMSSDATAYSDCYPAVRYVLQKLGDHHSFLMGAQSSKEWAEPEPDAYKKMPLTTGEIIEGKYAYLRMPGVNSGSEEANTYFADQLHDLLDSLAKAKPVGWILDLTANTGGNCWPMLAGIGPLLGEGPCGYFLVPGASTDASWYYKKGAAGIGKNPITKVSRKPARLDKKMPPVAVLTGPRTGSSGEVVTVAFRKRPNTRSFGEPTAGLSTGNQSYPLRDGSQIFLTTSVYADREKMAYGSKIIPDETVPKGAEDKAIEAAKKWLENR
ncbi:MAG: S41 family peptidase [Saprospiraceae bacterium]